MPNDATFELMAKAQGKSDAAVSLIVPPTYNIDEMDPRFCMLSLVFSGCYCLRSSKTIDPAYPGMVYIDGKATEPPFMPGLMPLFGQMIGIRVRKYLHDYNRAYQIRITGLVDSDGMAMADFAFALTTFPRIQPGERYPEHDEIVLNAAREGAVLLKNNNGALPLGKNAAVNVFGSGAIVFREGCLGAGKINPRYAILVREGIEDYSSLRLNRELYDFYTDEKDILPGRELLENAKALSETAVVFISRTSSEAHDILPEKGQYYLSDNERGLVSALRKEFSKVVAILNVAYPIESGWLEDVDAALLVGLPGMMGGRALAELLEGTASPSGRLTTTWPQDYWDLPASKNFLTSPDVQARCPDAKHICVMYEEGLYIGYRYFDTFNIAPAFRFGHGLSYTTFRQSGSVSGRTVTVTVKNAGGRPGKEVVQVYARLPEGRLEQPERRLVAFAKTKELPPGKQQTLTMRISDETLRSFDAELGAWIMEAGEVELFLNENLIGAISIPETIMLKKAGGRIPAPVQITELSKRDKAGTYPAGAQTKGFPGDALPYETPRSAPAQTEAFSVPDRLITFPEVVADPALLNAFIAQMSDYEMARLSVGGSNGWGPNDTGYAGQLAAGSGLEKYEIPCFRFADGNNGINMTEPSIGFPVSSTMCASWNEDLMYQEGMAIAIEAKDRGISGMLAPAFNLHRNILCGRNSEYFSEDPLLAGRMAGQQCRGLEEHGVAGCIKHFFANNAETMRNNSHSIMSERTARELYLAAFEFSFGVHMPGTVMTSYNAANGMFCSNDSVLLRSILRDEMGFSGFVMTDWGAYGNQGKPALIEQGVNWIAPGSDDDTDVLPVAQAIQDGTLSRDVMRNSLAELLRVVIKFSLDRCSTIPGCSAARKSI